MILLDSCSPSNDVAHEVEDVNIYDLDFEDDDEPSSTTNGFDDKNNVPAIEAIHMPDSTLVGTDTKPSSPTM